MLVSNPLAEMLDERIKSLDSTDPLRSFRSRFFLPKGVVYLDGNSLGALPVATAGRLQQVVNEEWGAGLIKSWNSHDWIGATQRVGNKIATLIGAKPGEVTVADSTSVNIFKLLLAAISNKPGRNIILTEAGNFPTDLYIAQGISGLFPNLNLLAVPGSKILEGINDQVAAILLTHVHYKTGYKHNLAEITRRAHQCGALIVWDLSHSVGAVDVNLAMAQVDLAVGCGYKYLNGGPGAPAFLFVAKHLQGQLRSPIAGWFGHAAPFEFSDEFLPAPNISRFLSGTPPILGLLALEVGVDLLMEAPLNAVSKKSQKLTALFIDLVESYCEEFDLEIVTPKNPELRGSHVSIKHEQGYAIVQALIARGIVGDFRSPDIMRFGFAPLYTSYEDVSRAVDILSDVMRTESWREFDTGIRDKVT